MNRPRALRVLLIEDDEEDSLFVRELLESVEGHPFELEWASSFDGGLETLAWAAVDVCLVDFRIGTRTGLEFVREARANGCQIPMVVLTGVGNKEIDHDAMRAGAAQYLEKGGLTAQLLERTIRYVVEMQHRTGQAGGGEVPQALHDSGPAPVAAEAQPENPRILLIEDDEDDYFLTQDLLSEAFGAGFELDWVQTWDQALEVIGEARHSIYIVDYRLGARNGLDLVRTVNDLGCTTPFIVLTGQGSRDIDFAAMHAGAADYLVKGELSAPLLERAIRYAIERSRSERRLAELARYDQLTGLANRNLFRDFLTKTLARADRENRLVAMMLLDLDRFKSVNDTHRHEAGDLLLREIALRLKDVVRQSDLLARLGGDEFTIVVDGFTDPSVLVSLAQRILQVSKKPVNVGHGNVFSSASIGIAVYPIDADNLEELVTSADAAMYEAKAQGADRYHFYTMKMRLEAARRQQLEGGLRAALERGELEVHYQPQFELLSGRVPQMEALLRWNHPQRGLIQSRDFIPIAEESGLIVAIGEWVLATACAQLRNWHEGPLPGLRVAVNFSARQFQDDDLPDKVARILDAVGLQSKYLEIEITESDIIKHPHRVHAVMQQFNELGVQIALDDFGTGYSSLNHLRAFPGATIKIDRSFIKNICVDPKDEEIVKAVINMAHQLDLKIVAEGVETSDQLVFLYENGCDIVQGYLLCRPAAPQHFGATMHQDLARKAKGYLRGRIAQLPALAASG